MKTLRASLAALAAAAPILVAAPEVMATEILPASARTRIFGTIEGSNVGETLAAAGDFDGDGLDDIVTGGRSRAFLVLGGPPGDITTDGPRAIELGFAAERSPRHVVVSGAGDVDGDGLADVLIGTAALDLDDRQNAGSAFLLLGRSNPQDLVLDAPDAAGVIRIDGASNGDRAGSGVAAAGDVDGDGIPDVLVGARGAGQGHHRGIAYVLFGKTLDSNVDLAALDDRGYRIHSPAFGRSVGASVASTGDMNGDGLDDAIIGAPSRLVVAPPAAYVVFGQASTEDVILGELGRQGWLIRAGDNEHEEGAGDAVAGGHDVNGDGVPDVVVGALEAFGRFGARGVAFVIFGKTDGATVRLDDLGDNGFRVEGGQDNEDAGHSVGMLPDQDGNGLADVLVGDPWRRETGPLRLGALYHLAGQSSTEMVDLGRLGRDGTDYATEEYEQLGTSVAGIGDFDGDGVFDIAAGADQWHTPNGGEAGAVFLVNPLEPPPYDPPPGARAISYAAYQDAELGNYCWDGVCVDRRPTFPRPDKAGTGNRAHFQVLFAERPDDFGLEAFRELDEFGRPAGKSRPIDARLKPVRYIRSVPSYGYEVVFRLPRRPGHLYLAGFARWEGLDRGDVSWFSHLRLTRDEARSNMSGPPDTTLRSGETRRKGMLSSYCWHRSFSNGTGVSQCSDYIRSEPLRPSSAETGAKAFIRIHSRYRPDSVRLRFYRRVSSGYPTGDSRIVDVNLRAHGRRAWDVHFEMPRRKGHLYPLMYATWKEQGSAPYDWHLVLR